MPTRPTGTIAVNESDLNYNDTATFAITANQWPVYALFHAYQNDKVVAVGYSNFMYANGSTGPMGMNSPIWQGGAAHCTVDLVLVERNKRRILASSSFEVAA